MAWFSGRKAKKEDCDVFWVRLEQFLEVLAVAMFILCLIWFFRWCSYV